jgi:hypothetical protein
MFLSCVKYEEGVLAKCLLDFAFIYIKNDALNVGVLNFIWK